MKKTLSVIMSIVIILTTCSVAMFVNAQERNLDINKKIFENILENRSWVIETLVHGDYSNNPYTEIANGATEVSLFKEVLTNYENDKDFKALVNVLETYRNTGTYVKEWGLEHWAYLKNFLNFTTDEEKEQYVEKYVKSVDDLQYESILNSVLSEDYTSSWGATLFESDSSLEHYRALAELEKKLQKVIKQFKDGDNLVAKAGFENDKAAMDYVDNFLEAYEDALYEMLESIPCCGFVKDHKTLTKKITGGIALSLSLSAGGFSPFTSPNDNQLAFSEIYSEYISDEAKRFLTVIDVGLKATSIATQYAIYLNTLVNQKNTTLGVLNRMKEGTSNEELANTINMYSKMFNEEGEFQLTYFDSVINYVANQDFIGKGIIKGTKKCFNSILNKRIGYFDGNKMVMTNAISEGLSKAGKCISIAIFVADLATNITDTAKKVYLCTYIEDVLNQAIATYHTDFMAYFENQTEENAKKCLDDLEFIKKLRLFGEKQAYGTVGSQADSIIGLLLGGDYLHSDIEQRYQGNIDSLLGCTLAATSVLEFSVKTHETLTLQPWQLKNGSYTIVGMYTNADGKTTYFPEADVILMSTVKLDGGTVNVMGSPDGVDPEVFFQKIESSGQSKINLVNGLMAIGEIENKGNLEIVLHSDNSEFTVACNLINSGIASFSGSPEKIYIQNIENSGTLDVEEKEINVYGSVMNDGEIKGNVNIVGDASMLYDWGYEEPEIQTVSGTGTYAGLHFASTAKKGVRVSGSPRIAKKLSKNWSTRIRTPENMIITGNCEIGNNMFDYNLRFEDFASAVPLKLGGIAFVSGDCEFAGDTVFKEGLQITSSCRTLTLNGIVETKGEVQYDGGNIQGDGWLKLYDDINITKDTPEMAKLDFVGVKAQAVNSVYPLTVKELHNNNLSIDGLSVNNTVFVTDTLVTGPTSSYNNGENIILTGNAKLDGNTINGNISAQDWVCTDSVRIKGNFNAKSDITIQEGVTLNTVSYNQDSGTLTLLEGASLKCIGDYVSKGSGLTLHKNASVVTDSCFYQSGSTVNNGSVTAGSDACITGDFDGGTVTVKGYVFASADFTPEKLILEAKLSQEFNNTANTTVNSLTINNTKGITINSPINVLDEFNDNNSNIINRDNIIYKTGNDNFIDGEVQGDLALTENLIIKSNETFTVNGNLTVSENVQIDIAQGGKLIVKGNVTTKSAQIVVGEDAVLQINDYFKSTSDTLDIAGDLIVNADARITSSAVTATGLITFKGDLETTSCTWNTPNIAFTSKLPQNISGDDITVNNLNIQNGSATGIAVDSLITYCGEYNNNNSVIVNETYIVSAY